MARLTWDRVGQREYESGIDRGVLYLEDTTGVAWNGLTGLDEDFGDDTSEPVYLDGIKYNDVPQVGDFTATLTAFTYPDEFIEYEGSSELGVGLFVDGQPSKVFGLSYRTFVGNDTDGIDHGYKLHIVYHLTAVPDTYDYQTLSDNTSPLEFSWKISGTPDDAPGFRPTAHVIFDSRYLNPEILAGIEDILYGTGDLAPEDITYDGDPPDDPLPGTLDGGDPDDPPGEIIDAESYSSGVTVPRLPSIEDLMNVVFFWDPRFIVPNTVTGLASLISGLGDLMQTNTEGIFVRPSASRLVTTSIDGIYVLD